MDKATSVTDQELSNLLDLKDSVEAAKQAINIAAKDLEISQLKMKNYLLTLYRQYNLSDKDQIMLEDGVIKYKPEEKTETNESNNQK